MSADIDGPYRYSLTRSTGEGDGTCCWVMLNPSTADAVADDPTCRKVVKFTRRWGFLNLVIVNLFAWRTSDPRLIASGIADGVRVVGRRNDESIREQAAMADRVVLAWGASPFARERARAVEAILEGITAPIVVLGMTKAGEPRHPLYVRDDTEPQAWGHLWAAQMRGAA